MNPERSVSLLELSLLIAAFALACGCTADTGGAGFSDSGGGTDGGSSGSSGVGASGGEDGSAGTGEAGASGGASGGSAGGGAGGVSGASGASGAAGADGAPDALGDSSGAGGGGGSAGVGPLGTAVRLDGVDDFVDLGSTQTYTSATGFSWELWFNLSDVPTAASVGRAQTLLGVMDGAGCEDIYLGFGSEFSEQRSLAFTVDGLGGCSARDSAPVTHRPPSGFEADRFYHVVGVVDYAGDEVLLYVDGVFAKSKPFTGTPLDRGLTVNVGRWYDGAAQAWVSGRIDELRVYSRPLTASEVNAHYAGGTGAPGTSGEPGLAGGWHFDEGAGTSAADFSPFARTGTLLGGWGPGIVPLP